jgi:hypothetical protein
LSMQRASKQASGDTAPAGSHNTRSCGCSLSVSVSFPYGRPFPPFTTYIMTIPASQAGQNGRVHRAVCFRFGEGRQQHKTSERAKHESIPAHSVSQSVSQPASQLAEAESSFRCSFHSSWPGFREWISRFHWDGVGALLKGLGGGGRGFEHHVRAYHISRLGA